MNERFWSLVQPTGFCWEWIGPTSRGYGRFSAGSRAPVAAHRYAYEALVGPVPEGLVLDHLCRNRSCVNPDHLEPVTNKENVLRGFGVTAKNATKTHCDNGHELDGTNSEGYRVCSACRSQWAKEYEQRRGPRPYKTCPHCGEARQSGYLARHIKLMHKEELCLTNT